MKEKTKKEDRSWNKYQTRPKYVKGEPDDHLQAKIKIGVILEGHGYTVWLEADIAKHKPIYHKGTWVKYWPVDVYAYKEMRQYIEYDHLIVQVDGGYHQASIIQKGRTENRDDTVLEYCKQHHIRYIVFDKVNAIDDILYEYTDEQLIRMLGLPITNK